MSGHDAGRKEKRHEGGSRSAPLKLTTLEFDVVELAATKGHADAVVALAAGRGVELPPMGRVSASRGGIALCVRPHRWLLLSPPQGAGAAGAAWNAAGIGAVIDLSSGLCAFSLEGTADAIPAALARGCRLDLDPQAFPVGHAAATIIAQVSVILVSLAEGILLLTPSTTARHFREWLEEQIQ